MTQCPKIRKLIKQLMILNKMHTRVHFTINEDINNTLSCLDSTVSEPERNFDYIVFQETHPSKCDNTK